MLIVVISIGIILAVILERHFYKPENLKGLAYAIKLDRKDVIEGETLWMEEIIHNKGIKLFPRIITNTEIINDMDEDSRTHHKGPNYFSFNHKTSLLFFQKVTISHKITAKRRGVYHAQLHRLNYDDLLMVDEHFLDILREEIFVVYPKIYPLEQFLPAPVTFSGDSFVKRFILEDYFFPIGVRDYAPGDNIKHIDWKKTAQVGQLKMRTYDYTSQEQLFIILNIQTSNSFSGGNDTEMVEQVITLGASLINAAHNENYDIGLFTNAGCIGYPGQTLTLTPGSYQGIEHLYEYTARLVNFPSLPFAQFLSNANQYFQPESNVIVITAFADDAINNALLRLKSSVKNFKIIAVGNSIDFLDSESLNVFQADMEGMKLND